MDASLLVLAKSIYQWEIYIIVKTRKDLDKHI